MAYATITIEEQAKAIGKKYNECYSLSLTATMDYSYCPYDFDSVMCWAPIKIGEIAVQSCPDYINGLRLRGKASRHCMENGNWLNYTDYENCISKNLIAIASMNYLGHAGYGLSLVFLILSILVMVRFKKLSCPRNTIHQHVFYAFLIRALMHFINLAIPSSITWLCRLSTALDYFSITASHTWVFVEALFLHNTLLLHLMRETPYTLGIYICVGWITPSVLSIAWSLLKYSFGNKECWQIDSDPHKRARWMALMYPIVTTLVNFALFINITRVVYLKATDRTNGIAGNRYKKLFKSTGILVIVFGIYDVILIPLVLLSEKINSESFELVQLYYEHTMTSCQGFLVALLFCFINSEVMKEVKRYYRQRMERRACLHEQTFPLSKSSLQSRQQKQNVRPCKRSSHNLNTAAAGGETS